jgi:hypothetical protein
MSIAVRDPVLVARDDRDDIAGLSYTLLVERVSGWYGAVGTELREFWTSIERQRDVPASAGARIIYQSIVPYRPSTHRHIPGASIGRSPSHRCPVPHQRSHALPVPG